MKTVPSLPSSIDAEKAVLGTLMRDAWSMDLIADVLESDDFSSIDHQRIFDAAIGLSAQGTSCDVVLVAGLMESQGTLVAAGGLAYLAQLAKNALDATDLRSYVELLRKCSLLRQLHLAASEIARRTATTDGREISDIIEEAEREIRNIFERKMPARPHLASIKQFLPAVVNRIDDLYHSKETLTGLATGFIALDRLTLGMQPGTLVLLAGQPSSGTTTLALNIAEHASLRLDKTVAIFSLDRPAEVLTRSLLASIGGIDQLHLRSGRLQEADWPRLDDAITAVTCSKLYIDETPAPNAIDIRLRARRLKREVSSLDLIVVDCLQLLAPGGLQADTNKGIAANASSLKALSVELRIPVIVTFRTKHGCGDDLMSGMREIDYRWADTVILLRREHCHEDAPTHREIAEIFVRERNGPQGAFSLAFIPRQARFRDLASVLAT